MYRVCNSIPVFEKTIKGDLVYELPGCLYVIPIVLGVIPDHGNGAERTALDAFGTALAEPCVDPGNIVSY